MSSFESSRCCPISSPPSPRSCGFPSSHWLEDFEPRAWLFALVAIAAEQRAPLGQVQEAEQCLRAKTIHPLAARSHLRHLGETPLSAALRERKDHVQRWDGIC
jgi:hypothetical protein